ncbi:hypothetical protein [Geobacillus stearothermophilus]|nr:hypothetical protein [Geobacillus stearothermophilus]
MVRDIGEQYSEIASYQQKTMSVEAQIPIEWVGDRERIHQLIVILLDNALKYTTEDGRKATLISPDINRDETKRSRSTSSMSKSDIMR